MRISAFRSALASVALCCPARGLAQTVDAGAFVILREGQQVGREDFTVRRGHTAGPAFTITSTASYPAVRPAVTITVTLELGTDTMPSAAQFDVAGVDERRIYALLGARRVTLRTVRPGREGAREYPGMTRRLVFDDSVFALHALMPRESGPSSTAFAPRTERRSAAATTWLGEGRTTIGGLVHTLNHAVLRIGDQSRHLWYDASGRLMKIEDAATGLVAERQEVPR